ncbi:toll/interleukin-1 receptor domain-containing protein [Arthrobacter sp. MDT1-48-3]
MKVFLSWSGAKTKSHAVARALDEWLPTVLNAVDPWVSSRGLVAGLQWNQQLDKELDGTSFGIIVVTPWNQHSQWLNFEAGALSKRVGGSEARVLPLLVDFPNVAKLTGPLSSYQFVLPTKVGIHSLVVSVNQALGDQAREFEALERAFEVCWPALESKLEEIKKDLPSEEDPATAPTPQPAAADDSDMLSEILNAVRSLARTDARLSNQLLRTAASTAESDRLEGLKARATDPSNKLLSDRIARQIDKMGYSVEAVIRDPSGKVTITLPRNAPPEQETDIVRGLDWARFHIKSMKFEPSYEGDDAAV